MSKRNQQQAGLSDRKDKRKTRRSSRLHPEDLEDSPLAPVSIGGPEARTAYDRLPIPQYTPGPMDENETMEEENPFEVVPTQVPIPRTGKKPQKVGKKPKGITKKTKEPKRKEPKKAPKETQWVPSTEVQEEVGGGMIVEEPVVFGPARQVQLDDEDLLDIAENIVQPMEEVIPGYTERSFSAEEARRIQSNPPASGWNFAFQKALGNILEPIGQAIFGTGEQVEMSEEVSSASVVEEEEATEMQKKAKSTINMLWPEMEELYMKIFDSEIYGTLKEWKENPGVRYGWDFPLSSEEWFKIAELWARIWFNLSKDPIGITADQYEVMEDVFWIIVASAFMFSFTMATQRSPVDDGPYSEYDMVNGLAKLVKKVYREYGGGPLRKVKPEEWRRAILSTIEIYSEEMQNRLNVLHEQVRKRLQEQQEVQMEEELSKEETETISKPGTFPLSFSLM